MAELFNNQRKLGVVVVDNGETMHNGLPVMGVRVMPGGVDFYRDKVVMGVEEMKGGEEFWNDQVVRGVVPLEDGIDFYNHNQVMPVFGLDPSQPPAPGPLDAIFGEDGLSSLVVEYDLAAHIAVLGVSTRFSGSLTDITASHGGEPLTKVRLDINAAQGIATALFIGNDLTIEPADVVVTPVGGATLGPAVMRINDDYVAASLGTHWNGGGVGSVWGNTPTQTMTGVSGLNGAIYAGGSIITGNELRPVPEEEYQRLSWLLAFAGVRVTDTPWMVSNWPLVGGEYVHTGNANGNLLYSLPIPQQHGIGFEIDVSIAEGAQLTILNLKGTTQMSRRLDGPYDGVWRVINGSDQYLTDRIDIRASGGSVTIRSLAYIVDPKVISGVFGRSNAGVVDGDTFSLNIPTSGGWAASVAEVYDTA